MERLYAVEAELQRRIPAVIGEAEQYGEQSSVKEYLKFLILTIMSLEHTVLVMPGLREVIRAQDDAIVRDEAQTISRTFPRSWKALGRRFSAAASIDPGMLRLLEASLQILEQVNTQRLRATESQVAGLCDVGGSGNGATTEEEQLTLTLHGLCRRVFDLKHGPDDTGASETLSTSDDVFSLATALSESGMSTIPICVGDESVPVLTKAENLRRRDVLHVPSSKCAFLTQAHDNFAVAVAPKAQDLQLAKSLVSKLPINPQSIRGNVIPPSSIDRWILSICWNVPFEALDMLSGSRGARCRQQLVTQLRALSSARVLLASTLEHVSQPHTN